MTKRPNKNRNIKDDSHSIADSKGDVRVGDISGGTGIAVGHNAQAIVTQTTGGGTDEIANIFRALQQKVNAMPDGPDKSMAKNVIQVMETEARTGDQATESQVQKWMDFLAKTAPDAWEVAVDIFINPIKGVGTVFKKIAEKAKAERDANKTGVAQKQ